MGNGSDSLIPIPEVQYDEDELEARESVSKETVHLDLGALGGRKPKGIPCLVIVGGRRSAGRVYPVRDGMTLGRAVSSDIVLEEEGVSRQHAKFSVTEDGTVRVDDLGSANGLFCRGQSFTSKVLEDGERVEIGDAAFAVLHVEAVEDTLRRNLIESAMMDDDTRLLVRRQFLEVLDRELAFARRFGVPVSLILVSVDQYTQLCDTHGVAAGPFALRGLASLIGRFIQIEDRVIARFAEAQLALLLPDTPATDADRTAKWIHASAKQMTLSRGEGSPPMSFTVSVGLATADSDNATGASMVEEAERSLYRAKSAGGNAIGERPRRP